MNRTPYLFAEVARNAQPFIVLVLRLHTPDHQSDVVVKGAIITRGNESIVIPMEATSEAFEASETHQNLMVLTGELLHSCEGGQGRKNTTIQTWHGGAACENNLCVAVTGYDTEWGSAQAGVILNYLQRELAKLQLAEETLRAIAA